MKTNTVCLFLFGSLLSISGMAQPGKDSTQVKRNYTIDEVVVTGTRNETDIRHLPMTISVVGRQQIEKRYEPSLLPLLPDLKLLAGGAVHGMGGFIYNTRNGNNPASAKADIDLNISAMAIYKLRVKEYPMTLRYQFTIPFAGVLFSPHYGQSYYEIFNLGNASGVVQFNSFHNKFAMKNFFTVDFPVCNFTIRAGYLNSSYRTDVNGIQSHIISHSFMIGLVKEFISFGGKRLKNTQRFRSAYY